MALVMALGILTVLTAVGGAVMSYSTSNQTEAAHSRANDFAYQYAEAGINMALAVLNNSSNNAGNQYLLPARTTSMPYGSVTWSGVLTHTTWTITGVGKSHNPSTSAPGSSTRTITMQVPIVPVYTSSPLTNQSWNYVYVYGTGQTCDFQMMNLTVMSAPLYVMGNACLNNSAWISGSPVQIGGKLTFNQNGNSIGQSNAPVTGGVHIVGGCSPTGSAGPYHVPCTSADRVYANPVPDTNLASITAPTPSWSSWYLNASPGPYFACQTSSGTPPTFDNDQGSVYSPDATKENLSVTGGASAVTLTPAASSYTCKNDTGELSWNATTNVLTVNGTVFIDGNTRIDAGGAVQYTGMGTLLVSGSFVLKGTNLCAVFDATGKDCNWTLSSWDTTKNFLDIVSGDKVTSALCCPPDIPNYLDTFEMAGSHFQGGIETMQTLDVSTSSATEGPLVEKGLTIGQTLTTYPFPALATVPAGLPGQAVQFAIPQPPKSFTG